jgi:hypothetical protein
MALCVKDVSLHPLEIVLGFLIEKLHLFRQYMTLDSIIAKAGNTS